MAEVLLVGTCEHCHYLGYEDGRPVCRRHAPKHPKVLRLPDDNTLYLGRWPRVRLTDSCGDLARRVDLPK